MSALIVTDVDCHRRFSVHTMCVRLGFRSWPRGLKTTSDLVPSVRFELTLYGF